MSGMRASGGGRAGAAPVVVITGPTASGKSGLALAVARAFDGEVINADSMQVYRELEILTARPGPAALAEAPHRLYGILPGCEPCSAGQWRARALQAIEAAHAAGRLPLLVGGTGLYLKALKSGLAPLPPVPAEVRRSARALLARLGGPAFHAALAERDPAMAERLRPSDSQRLVRAWEVLEATGRSLAAWQREPGGTPPYRFLEIVVLPPRAVLYAACNGRFEAMVATGALAEVERLLALGLDPKLPVMKALGVPELAACLRGEIGRAEAVARAQQATRRYAKRQTTWLRTQGSLAPEAAGGGFERHGAGVQIGNNRTVLILEAQYSPSVEPITFSFIRQQVLTPPD